MVLVNKKTMPFLFNKKDINLIQCNYHKMKESNVSFCKKDNPNYNKLKDLWKLISKNENLSQKC